MGQFLSRGVARRALCALSRRASRLVALLLLAQGCHGCGARSKPVVAHAANNDQSRSNMPPSTMSRYTLANPGLVTSYQVGLLDQWAAYGLAAAGDRRILETTEFYEAGPEREDVSPFKPSSWGVEVPDGAELFAVTSGITPENARQFWVGWLVGRRVHMQALMQEKPIDTELAGDETGIFPAVMDKAGVAALYAWRPVPEGTALWRHLFTGQLKARGTAETEALTEIPGRPVVSVAGAIPGEAAQHALIGWAESTPAGAVLGIAIIKPTRVRVVRSEPIPGFLPLARQRPGIWASAPPAGERYELTVALQSREAPYVYQTARLSVGANAEDRKVAVAAIPLPADRLHAAAFDYLKNHVDVAVNRTYLTTDGQLWLGDPPRPSRQGVPLDSPLPVLATGKVYWGVRGADGKLAFESF